MRNVIQKLYDMYMDGNGGTDNEMALKIPGDLCKEKKRAAYQSYRELRAKLSEDLAEELDVLMDKQLEIYPQELEESFSAGFKTGARLMCEIFADGTNVVEKTDSNKI